MMMFPDNPTQLFQKLPIGLLQDGFDQQPNIGFNQKSNICSFSMKTPPFFAI